ncbi:MAG: UbiA family prenyltransferase [Bacteroidota bacterium]
MSVAASPVLRGWTYLQERFPLGAHGPLVAAFAGGVACASAALRGAEGPGWPAVVVAVVVALGFFFQLRVADEWKDAETDRLHQPERPVPRGLVTLRELTVAALLVAAAQLALALWLAPRLGGVVLAVWAFGALMTVEFGVRDWLRTRPLATLVTHAPIVPFIDAFAVSADVLGNEAAYPAGVGWLIGVSLFGGSVVEVGRKIRQPADERPGVETYSALWGRGRAVGLFLLVLAASLGCGLMVVHAIGGVGVLAVALVVGAAVTAALTLAAVRDDTPGRGRWIETASGIWTLALYLTIGPLALFLS